MGFPALRLVWEFAIDSQRMYGVTDHAVAQRCHRLRRTIADLGGWKKEWVMAVVMPRQYGTCAGGRHLHKVTDTAPRSKRRRHPEAGYFENGVMSGRIVRSGETRAVDHG